MSGWAYAIYLCALKCVLYAHPLFKVKLWIRAHGHIIRTLRYIHSPRCMASTLGYLAHWNAFILTMMLTVRASYQDCSLQ